MLQEAEKIRITAARNLSSVQKTKFGQYFTPLSIAAFMASLFDNRRCDTIRLLDAGAGVGSLSAAFLGRCVSGDLNCHKVEVDAFEIDTELHPYLSKTLEQYNKHIDLVVRIIGKDFITTAVEWLTGNLFQDYESKTYSHAILNPPYKKIRSNSRYRLMLRRAGIETVNLYPAFVALVLSLLEKNGELVAIIPRSFCNGSYYRPFRQHILARAAIRRLHLFHSRNKAFKDDDVLQENIIIKLERGGNQEEVIVSTSTDDQFDDLDIFKIPFDQIVFPDDRESFIHVPTSPEKDTIEISGEYKYSLKNLGLSVSTGPVVDFRVKEHLCKMPEHGTAPLLYPTHFRNGKVVWPLTDTKKPNAIRVNNSTQKWLYPTGYYCIVRRFTSKEEKRRIVASVVEPQNFKDALLLGFENHLNIIHCNKQGLSPELAYGLAAYLNSELVDKCFRRFSGNTQVNATDLRLLRFPGREVLIRLGKWVLSTGEVMSPRVDEQLMGLAL